MCPVKGQEASETIFGGRWKLTEIDEIVGCYSIVQSAVFFVVQFTSS